MSAPLQTTARRHPRWRRDSGTDRERWNRPTVKSLSETSTDARAESAPSAAQAVMRIEPASSKVGTGLCDGACREWSMNVLVFASRKGGSGKSTLAAHLAAHANGPSRPCLLVDDDPQGSLRLWNALRNYEALPLKTVDRSIPTRSSQQSATASNGSWSTRPRTHRQASSTRSSRERSLLFRAGPAYSISMQCRIRSTSPAQPARPMPSSSMRRRPSAAALRRPPSLVPARP
jgi:hypothetical protein